MTSSSAFLVLAATSMALLVGLVAVSVVIGTMRHRAGHQLSEEIERAAGMQGRWRQKTNRAEADGAKGGHAAA